MKTSRVYELSGQPSYSSEEITEIFVAKYNIKLRETNLYHILNMTLVFHRKHLMFSSLINDSFATAWV